jgi:hypothetical protein
MEVKYNNEVSTSYPTPFYPIRSLLYYLILFHSELSYSIPSYPIPSLLYYLILFNSMLCYPIQCYCILSYQIIFVTFHLISFHSISSHLIFLIVFYPVLSHPCTSHLIPSFTFHSIISHTILFLSSCPILFYTILGRHGEVPRDRNTGPPSRRGREISHYDVRDTEPPSALSIAERSEAEENITRSSVVSVALFRHCLCVCMSECLYV